MGPAERLAADQPAGQGLRAGDLEGRAEEAEAILSWAFRQFVEKSLVKADTQVATADVWMGKERSVGLVVNEDFTTLLPVLASKEVPAEVVYSGPVSAPVSKGDELAKLVISPEGLPETSIPLYAANDVPAGGFMVRIRTVSTLLLSRLQQGPEGQL